MRRFRTRLVARGIHYSLLDFGSNQTRPILHRSDIPHVHFQRTWTMSRKCIVIVRTLFVCNLPNVSLIVGHTAPITTRNGR